MTKEGILNPDLCQAIAACGHTDRFVIADSGLPIPAGVKLIDLSLIRGIPRFMDVLKAVDQELVVESCILADETESRSPALYQQIKAETGALPIRTVSHEELKKLTADAKVIVRTGETTPFANIILCCGVNF